MDSASATSASSMTSSTKSSAGRERALEILMDHDPLGSYYRAARVIEEVVPNAYASRPNLITKAALVDQAFSLSEYAIDNFKKYDDAYPAPEQTPISAVDALSRERVLNHFNRTQAVQSSTPSDNAGALADIPPETPKGSAPSTTSLSSSTAVLVAALRKLFDESKDDIISTDASEPEDRTFELRRLLKEVTSHPAITVASAPTYKQQMEMMIAYLCRKSPYHSYEDKQPVEEEHLQGLLLAILSLLLSPQEDIGQASTKPREPAEQTTLLQVASLLTLLPVPKDGDQFAIVPEILEYFGKAVAVTEERLEIKKARMLQRLHTPAHGSTEEDERVVADNRVEAEESGNSSVFGSDDALQDAFEHFVSTMAQAAADSVDYPLDSLEHLVVSIAQSEAEVLPDDAAGQLHLDDPTDYPDLLQRREPSSSSSSDSSDSGDSSDFSSNDAENDEEEGDDENDAVVGSSELNENDTGLTRRQAQEGSTNTSTSMTVDMESPFILEEQGRTVGSIVDVAVPETSGSNAGTDAQESASRGVETLTEEKVDLSEDDETDLPPVPTPPSEISQLLFDRETMKNALDPSMSTFGTIPDSLVLVHILRHTSLMMARRRACCRTEKQAWDTTSIPGGIGSTLFSPAVPVKGEHPERQGWNSDLTLQLLVSSVILIDEKRNESIQCLQQSIARENRTMESSTSASELNNSTDEDAALLSSGEEDDPAVAFALNYVEDDAPLSSESLENKGMRRKAAAAAYDSAALLKSQRKETKEWNEHVCLYSQCLVQSLRLLRLYLQSSIRVFSRKTSSGPSGLEEGDTQRTEDENLNSLYLSSRLPKAVALKLSGTLSSLMSSRSQSSFRSTLGKDAEHLLFALYTESVNTWGDCIPILYPSFHSISDLLKGLLLAARKGSSFGSRERLGATYGSLRSITRVPSHTSEVDVHRLEVLCRRLRVGDMLDLLVFRPVPFIGQREEDVTERSLFKASLDVPLSSSILALLGASLDNLEGATEEVQRLYLALCHRFHTQILLMDGLYATTKTEADEAATSPSRHKTSSSGDYLRINKNPSAVLEFDATKCADSIAILSDSVTAGNGSSVHQRASKVWGTVISTRHFAPKTGIHRWAVRLDKCERGHVFIGVATSQCSMKTYVGGDKYGWGMIGTQALWHDRRKIRGDYGATLRSGAIVVVTLDTDAGTLSFGLWKDGSSSSSFQSGDSSVQTAVSPKRQFSLTGSLDDWGIAFEGLPLDSRLFPAIGLYQRDDRVSLLSVVEGSGRLSGLGTNSQSMAGERFYPGAMSSPESDDLASRVRKFNDLLCFDGVRYTTETLQFISETISQKPDHVVLTKVLPSLASSLCLISPSVPILSARSAILLIPHIRRCLDVCSRFQENLRDTTMITDRIAEGKWLIRAAGSGSGKHDIEEYYLDVDCATRPSRDLETTYFQGSGRGISGKSKNGKIDIHGSVCGSSLSFVEEWLSDSEDILAENMSSCIVNARMSLSGDRFEGVYRNVQYGTSGHIAGKLVESRLAPSFDDQRIGRSFYVCRVMLAMAQGHLSTLLCDSTDLQRIELWRPQSSDKISAKRIDLLTQVIDLPIFSTCSLEKDYSSHSEVLKFLKSAFLSELPKSELCGINYGAFLEPTLTILHSKEEQSVSSRVDFDILVAESDAKLVDVCGGQGSLRSLCPELYTMVRRRLVRVFLHFSGRFGKLRSSFDEQDLKSDPDLENIWRGALKIVEDGVRKALSQTDVGISRQQVVKTVCERFLKLADFFLDIIPSESLSVQDVSMSLSAAFELILTDDDIDFLKKGMSLATGRAILRLLAVKEISGLIIKARSEKSLSPEAIVLALPRQLGRGRPIDFNSTCVDSAPKLDGNYLSGLAGASVHIKSQLKAVVSSIYRELGAIIEGYANRLESGFVAASDSDVVSTLLSILPVFACQFKFDEFDDFLSSSKIVTSISGILACYRKNLLATTKDQSDQMYCNVPEELVDLCKRDLFVSMLRCCSAVAHVLLFQASSAADQRNHSKIVSEFVSLLLNELAAIFPIIEMNWRVSLGSATLQRVDDDYERWLNVGLKVPAATTSKILRKDKDHSLSCIEYIRLFGFHSKPAIANKARVSRLGPKSSFISSSFHELLSQWLNAQCAMFRSPSILKEVANSTKWTNILLNVAGVTLREGSSTGIISSAHLRSHADGMLPARFRARILRLILPLLIESESNRYRVIEGLFELAGATSPIISNSMDGDETSVSIECISLLRRLYAPVYKQWRNCVNVVITDITDPSNDAANRFRKKVGVLSFFAGTMRGISHGSHVILKSANAAALTAEHSVPSNSKSHSSAIGGSATSGTTGSPHHLVGNGTELIVAGLSCHEAASGIVSSIDMKNGLCEVILFPRDAELGGALGKPDWLDSDDTKSRRKGTRNRQSLTIRALRIPLPDTFLVPEVPLYLDASLPVTHILGKLLDQSLSTLLSAVSMTKPEEHSNSESSGGENEDKHDVVDDSDNTRKPSSENLASEQAQKPKDPEKRKDASVKTGVVGLTCDVLLIRACIVVLSQEDLLNSFMKEKSHQETLKRILNLAWPETSEAASNADFIQDVRSKSLSFLPFHETRLEYLTTLLQDVTFRSQVLHHLPDDNLRNKLERLLSTETDSSEPRRSNSASPQSQEVTNPRTLGPKKSRQDVGERGRIPAASQRQSSSSRGNVSDDEEDSEAANTAAEHLWEAAIAQMAELGLPRSWSELALRRVGGLDIEAAVTFCLECGGEMERLLAEERERERMIQRESSGGSSGIRRVGREISPSNHLIQQLMEMGFPRRWCVEALAVTGNNLDEALTWILNNGERLSEEDEAMGDGDGDEEEQDDDDDEYDDDDEALVDESRDTDGMDKASSSLSMPIFGWNGSVTPLRFISGRSIIDPVTLEISGLPNGGFSSVGTKGILLTSGKWYYEATLLTAGCLQIGWADGSFSGHCHADKGDGCGDGPSSWAFDGWRRYRWHSTATEWGCRWKEGDVVGCMVDMDAREVSFTLNGNGESVGMGVAFSGEGFRPCSGGVYASVSFNRREKIQLVLGGKGCAPFKYPPPAGYKGVGEAVLEGVLELDSILEKEKILCYPKTSNEKAFLCDFSDGEHGHELLAWGHRYYGADASVHLGAASPKQTSGKGLSQLEQPDSPDVYVSRRVENAWSSDSISSHSDVSTVSALRAKLQQGYQQVEETVAYELFNECIAVAVLLSRKLILHSAAGMGSSFDPGCFADSEERSTEILGQLWRVVEVCGSLRSSGWAGEAGAMAIAAEALGLGISSNDPIQSKSFGDRSGIVPSTDLDTGLLLPVCGNSLLLSSAHRRAQHKGDEVFEFLVKAELPLCSAGGGGVTSFMQESLLSAVCRSNCFRSILIASIRRAVRLLAVIEYNGDDSLQSETKEEGQESGAAETPSTKPNEIEQPDPRLTAFVSGLILSKETESSLPTEFSQFQCQIAEAWSFGLLSASLPWRMICAFTVAGIVNSNPSIFSNITRSSSTLARYFGRLPSTVLRRVWAERAAVPVCSRYVQSMIELLCAVKNAVKVTQDLPDDFQKYWGSFDVDAATPIPLDNSLELPDVSSDELWQSKEGWACSNSNWVTWLGRLNYEEVKWKPPIRSSVPALMDGGEGPPFLDVGCTVLRGPDWEKDNSGAIDKNEDGKDNYDQEKRQRERENHPTKDSKDADPGTELPQVDDDHDSNDQISPEHPLDQCEDAGNPPAPTEDTEDTNTKRKPSPRLPTGTVLAVEKWNGIPAMGRRVRWHLTNAEGVYRFGGDGGRFDICHVEVNKKSTRVKKRHPLPETAEQCAYRHGFGQKKSFAVILRLERSPIIKDEIGIEASTVRGVLELPDLGAGILVTCAPNIDGTMILREESLLFGSKDSGWEIRFGQPSYIPGTVYKLGVPTSVAQDPDDANMSLYQETRGHNVFEVASLRNPENGSVLSVESELRFRKPFTSANNNLSPGPPPFCFDPLYHSGALALSRDRRTVTCVGSEGRATAYADVGFTKGVHYWEVKLEQADIGSVFIGVAEKNNGSGSTSAFDSSPRLNRWLGWGFVNFRATYTSGAERVYGAHCHSGDTVGVLLDCDAGRVSFFFDGLKYGEHILNDLGCAFEHLSPFGFNVDGCGSGGAGQGAPNGFEGGRSGRYPSQGAVRPRSLFPVVGLRNQGDRVTISSKWNTSLGIDGAKTVNNILAVEEVVSMYHQSLSKQSFGSPAWLVKEAFSEYQRWSKSSFSQFVTRGSGPYRLANFGLDIIVDTSPIACAEASASLGLSTALLAGDRVRLTRSAGRLLELTEEATILGSFNGRLYYRIASQKSEGGSLTEGGGRAWCLDESEVVDGLPHVTPAKGLGVPLPKLGRFSCPSGGLQVVHESGAVLRSDLEIYDGSIILGTIPVGTLLSKNQVTERRVNSCGVVRYRIQHDDLGEGWISARIRGGQEEVIVVPIKTDEEEADRRLPSDCATEWYDRWISEGGRQGQGPQEMFLVEDIENFKSELTRGIFPGLTMHESDTLLVAAVNAVSNLSESGDSLQIGFHNLASALAFAIHDSSYEQVEDSSYSPTSNSSRQAAAAVLAKVEKSVPNLKALMSRIAFLRALNRRIKLALPWMSIRPCQEGSAILGGTSGHGAAVERSGRSRLNQAQKKWIQVPGIATALRKCRGLFFSSVKREFIQSITEATTTPTPLSHDEYELPREIRTVRVNRLKAGRTMMAHDVLAKRKHSVFAQLRAETKSWGGAALRRGYVAKGHGGQKRAFKVKLIGEGVNDYSGPYREVFTDAFREVSHLEGNGVGSLGVLDATPNQVSDVGENRGLYMFSLNGRVMSSPVPKLHMRLDGIQQSFGILTLPRDETSREVEDSLVFLGRMVGTAFRHGISVDLPLPIQSVWKALTEEDCELKDQIEELDYLASRQMDENKSDGSYELILWQRRMLNPFTEGLSSVLPVELFPILTGEELRDSICGHPEVDVDLLKRVVEIEGFEKDDEVIEFFWETLREMSDKERMQFLQFVWARNRLPLRESDFEAPFKILKDSINQGEKADLALPSASTCFFSLTLPKYSSKEILRQKLLFAITHVTTMETDFQTNSAEISEGYRAF